MFITSPYLVLKIAERWVDSKGRIRTGEGWPGAEPLELTSQPYPYASRLVIRQSDRWKYVSDYAAVSLILFPLLSLFIAFMTYSLLGRVGGPKAALKEALEKKQFIPYLQPVVDGSTHAVTGAEVLMRWQHPHSGLIPPYQFIPLAEESGLIVPMTRLVMTQVREQFVPLVSQMSENFHLGFNTFAMQF